MRRIVLVLLLVAVFVVAGYMLLRPKRGPARAKSSTTTVKNALTDEGSFTGSSAKAVVRPSSRSAKQGKVAGSLKASTREERRAKTKQIRAEERRRKKELRRQERDKKRMLKTARATRGKRKTRKGGDLYVLKAIVAVGGQSFALIDGRNAQVGDVVMGQKIVGIGQDRIEVEAFGRRSTVRVGESLLPSTYTPGQR